MRVALVMAVALLDVQREGIKTVVADGALGRGRVEAEMRLAGVVDPRQRLQIVAGADAHRIVAAVAGEDRDIVVGIVLGAKNLELGHGARLIYPCRDAQRP